MIERYEKVLKALAKYGIHTEEQLDQAIKKMKPLNISCMVSPVNINIVEKTSHHESENEKVV